MSPEPMIRVPVRVSRAVYEGALGAVVRRWPPGKAGPTVARVLEQLLERMGRLDALDAALAAGLDVIGGSLVTDLRSTRELLVDLVGPRVDVDRSAVVEAHLECEAQERTVDELEGERNRVLWRAVSELLVDELGPSDPTDPLNLEEVLAALEDLVDAGRRANLGQPRCAGGGPCRVAHPPDPPGTAGPICADCRRHVSRCACAPGAA